MRWSSGKVSCETSMTGGWYVWIMESGRCDMRDSGRAWAVGLGDGSWLLSYTVLVTEKDEALGSLAGAFATEGLAGAGDAGFTGEAAAEAVDVLRRCRRLPPHSDMKERTGRV